MEILKLGLFYLLFLLILAGLSAGCNSESSSSDEEADTTPPTVISVSPSDSSSDVLLNTLISVIFSESMDASTVTTNTADSNCSGSIQVSIDDFNTCVQMSVAPAYSLNGSGVASAPQTKTFTLTPGTYLSESSVYKIKITTAVKDVAGNALASPFATTNGFTTSTQLVVSSVSPTDLSGCVPLGSSISVTFSKEMDERSFTSSNFTLSDESGDVSGSVLVSGFTATFTPSSTLSVYKKYTVTLGNTLTDVAGNSLLNGHVSNFSTGIQPSLTGGGWHALAISYDCTVWTWGYNTSGQLGTDTTPDTAIPTKVVGADGTGYLSDVIAVSGGDEHSLALKNDGTVWAFGDNGQGQLGDGTFTLSGIPVQVSGLTDVVAIEANSYQSFALKSDGTVWGWGDDWYYQLGAASTDTCTNWDCPYPIQVAGPGGTGFLTDVIEVAAGYFHTLALKSDGTVWSWGDESYGELGQGFNSQSQFPVQVCEVYSTGCDTPLSNVIHIAAGSYHSFAVKSDGTVWAWGDNISWELGIGTTSSIGTPTQVCAIDETPACSIFLDSTSDIVTSDQAAATLINGAIVLWGSNFLGVLGTGDYLNPAQSWVPFTPTPVSSLGTIDALGLSQYETIYALKSDGTVWGWGRSGNLQVIDATFV